MVKKSQMDTSIRDERTWIDVARDGSTFTDVAQTGVQWRNIAFARITT